MNSKSKGHPGETNPAYRHGHATRNFRSRTYTTWANMIARCTKPSNHRYEDYGGRGIKVCKRWMVFSNFLADMGAKPVGLTIDRENNDGNYEPGNCYWATNKEQKRHRRDTVIFEIDGIVKPLFDWCEQMDIRYMLVYTRIYRGKWNHVQAILTPPCNGKLRKQAAAKYKQLINSSEEYRKARMDGKK